jgi:hypothetical protein
MKERPARTAPEDGPHAGLRASGADHRGQVLDFPVVSGQFKVDHTIDGALEMGAHSAWLRWLGALWGWLAAAAAVVRGFSLGTLPESRRGGPVWLLAGEYRGHHDVRVHLAGAGAGTVPKQCGGPRPVRLRS